MGIHSRLITDSITVGPIGANCHLLWTADGDELIIADPGDEPDAILARIESLGPRRVTIWLTHAHIDHINGAGGVMRATGAGLLVHPAEKDWLSDPVRSGASWLGVGLDAVEATGFVDEGTRLAALGREWLVLHVPGHSPGCVVYYSAQDDLAIGGDLLFRGSIGRTDLPGGDARAMSRSLRRIVAELPHETRFLVGHGPDTTLATEVRENPYVRMVMASSAPA